jgi:soluble lytic murein transglycosylase-like protein
MRLLLQLTLFSLVGHVMATEVPMRSMASIRNEHARELFGSKYDQSVVATFESKNGLEKNIFSTVKDSLPKKYKPDAQEIARTIVLESRKHQLDPYFVMAVISGESSFNPNARGPVGEIGLMQLRLSTGEWISKISKIKWNGEKSLKDPVENIKLGTAYLAWLRNKFNGHGQLYLAAYNMGPASVKSAMGRNVWPKDYPKHVMKRYIAFYKEL